MRRLSVATCLALAAWSSTGLATQRTLAAARCVGSGPGCYATIQAALDAAHNGDVILVGPGTFAGGTTIATSVRIIGAGAASTIIQGGGPVVTILPSSGTTQLTVSISGVTITGGSNTANPSPFQPLGGGISVLPATSGSSCTAQPECVGATVTINNSVITGNSAIATGSASCGSGCSFSVPLGGGISNSGTMTLNNTTVSNNSATFNVSPEPSFEVPFGGGIETTGVASLTLHNSSVSGNTARVTTNVSTLFGGGGGIRGDGQVTVDGSTIAGNSVYVASTNPNSDIFGIGGGVFLTPRASASIRGSVITNNSVTATGVGGGVDVGANAIAGGIDDDGSILLVGSIVSNNRVNSSITSMSTTSNSASDAGGMEIDGAATIKDTQFTGNSATSTSPAAIANGGASPNGGALAIFTHLPVTIDDSVISGNSLAGTTTSGVVNLAGGGIFNSILGPLWLEDHGMLSDQAKICRYLPQCPASWQPITVRMALDGSSGLPGFDTSTPGQTTAESLRILQGEPLDHAPGASVGYQNGEVLVLSLITEKVSGQPFGTFIRRAFLDPAGMAHSGRLLPETAPPSLAESYSGRAHKADALSDSTDFFAAYATASDVYAYDNTLFGGKLVSRRSLNRLFGPRDLVPDPPTGFSQVRYGYWWRTGQVVGHRVVFTVRGTAANLRFPRDEVTIVVLGNDDWNDVGEIAAHLAALTFGQHLPAPSAPAMDPARAIVATINGPVGTFPFTFTEGALWFPTQSNQGDRGTVTRIDTRTNRIVATIVAGDPRSVPPPSPDPGAVAAANGQVWAIDRADKAVVRIDPATNRVVATVRIGVAASALAIGGNALWASTPPEADDNTIVRVDLRTLKVAATIAHAGHPLLLSAGPDALWYVATESNTVPRVDAATNRIVATIKAGPNPISLAVGADAVWVWDHSGTLLTRIDPRTNRVRATISLAGYPGQPDCWCQNVAVGAGAVWAVGGSRTLLRIDPRTNKVISSLALHRPGANVGVGDGSVWVASDGGDAFQIDRIDPRFMR